MSDNKKSLNCQFCEYIAPNANSMRVHRNRYHSGMIEDIYHQKKTFTCPICESDFKDNYNLQRHLNKKVKCSPPVPKFEAVPVAQPAPIDAQPVPPIQQDKKKQNKRAAPETGSSVQQLEGEVLIEEKDEVLNTQKTLQNEETCFTMSGWEPDVQIDEPVASMRQVKRRREEEKEEVKVDPVIAEQEAILSSLASEVQSSANLSSHLGAILKERNSQPPPVPAFFNGTPVMRVIQDPLIPERAIIKFQKEELDKKEDILKKNHLQRKEEILKQTGFFPAPSNEIIEQRSILAVSQGLNADEHFAPLIKNLLVFKEKKIRTLRDTEEREDAVAAPISQLQDLQFNMEEGNFDRVRADTLSYQRVQQAKEQPRKSCCFRAGTPAGLPYIQGDSQVQIAVQGCQIINCNHPPAPEIETSSAPIPFAAAHNRDYLMRLFKNYRKSIKETAKEKRKRVVKVQSLCSEKTALKTLDLVNKKIKQMQQEGGLAMHPYSLCPLHPDNMLPCQVCEDLKKKEEDEKRREEEKKKKEERKFVMDKDFQDTSVIEAGEVYLNLEFSKELQKCQYTFRSVREMLHETKGFFNLFTICQDEEVEDFTSNPFIIFFYLVLVILKSISGQLKNDRVKLFSSVFTSLVGHPKYRTRIDLQQYFKGETLPTKERYFTLPPSEVEVKNRDSDLLLSQFQAMVEEKELLHQKLYKFVSSLCSSLFHLQYFSNMDADNAKLNSIYVILSRWSLHYMKQCNEGKGINYSLLLSATEQLESEVEFLKDADFSVECQYKQICAHLSSLELFKQHFARIYQLHRFKENPIGAKFFSDQLSQKVVFDWYNVSKIEETQEEVVTPLDLPPHLFTLFKELLLSNKLVHLPEFRSILQSLDITTTIYKRDRKVREKKLKEKKQQISKSLKERVEFHDDTKKDLCYLKEDLLKMGFKSLAITPEMEQMRKRAIAEREERERREKEMKKQQEMTEQGFVPLFNQQSSFTLDDLLQSVAASATHHSVIFSQEQQQEEKEKKDDDDDDDDGEEKSEELAPAVIIQHPKVRDAGKMAPLRKIPFYFHPVRSASSSAKTSPSTDGFLPPLPLSQQARGTPANKKKITPSKLNKLALAPDTITFYEVKEKDGADEQQEEEVIQIETSSQQDKERAAKERRKQELIKKLQAIVQPSIDAAKSQQTAATTTTAPKAAPSSQQREQTERKTFYSSWQQNMMKISCDRQRLDSVRVSAPLVPLSNATAPHPPPPTIEQPSSNQQVQKEKEGDDDDEEEEKRLNHFRLQKLKSLYNREHSQLSVSTFLSVPISGQRQAKIDGVDKRRGNEVIERSNQVGDICFNQVPKTVSLTYSEITPSGFNKVLNQIKNSFPATAAAATNSPLSFLDIGSGRGRCCYQAALTCPELVSVDGIEYQDQMFRESLTIKNKYIKLVETSDPEAATLLSKVHLRQGDVTELCFAGLGNYNCLYCYNPTWGETEATEELMEKLCQAINNTPSWQVLVWAKNPQASSNFGLKNFLCLDSFSVKNASKESHTFYVMIKVEKEEDEKKEELKEEVKEEEKEEREEDIEMRLEDLLPNSEPQPAPILAPANNTTTTSKTVPASQFSQRSLQQGSLDIFKRFAPLVSTLEKRQQMIRETVPEQDFKKKKREKKKNPLAPVIAASVTAIAIAAASSKKNANDAYSQSVIEDKKKEKSSNSKQIKKSKKEAKGTASIQTYFSFDNNKKEEK